MRKEVVFAIFFGAAFGLVIAFGVWRLNSSLSERGQASKVEATAAPTPSSSFGLTISKPVDFQVFREAGIKVEGVTKSGSWIVASGMNSDTIMKSDNDGGFSSDVDLFPGLNQVVITGIEENSGKTEKTLSLVYSSQFPSADGSTSKEASDSASVDEKVKEKINETENPPTSYLGTVTDIAETTIHLKNTTDELKQVSTESSTTYSNENTKKEIKFSDVAIGDFIIAMGYKNGNQVLHAKRIVVSKKPTKPEQLVSVGTVKTIKNKLLTLASKDGDIELTFPKKWSGPDSKELSTDDKVIAVSVESDGNNNIRTIEILK